MDYLVELAHEENLRASYLVAKEVAEGYAAHRERAGQSLLSPFWELRMIERLTLAFYLEAATAEVTGARDARALVSYHTGSKLLEAAESLRSQAGLPQAVEDLVAGLAEAPAASVIKATALADEALGLLEEGEREGKDAAASWA